MRARDDWAVRRLPHERDRLAHATARLDLLDLHDVPVSLERVRVLVEPRLFRVPGFRRYRGYSFWQTIVVSDVNASSDLLTHELCHVWQAQRRPIAQLWAWVRHSYRSNPFEREARAAVGATRDYHRHVDDAHKTRLARNEDLFRQVNEKIEDLATRHGDDAHVYEFFCECSDVDCSERVCLTLGDYEHVRDNPARFVVVKGHELLEIEHVIERAEDHVLIEKHGRAGEVAIKLDAES